MDITRSISSVWTKLLISVGALALASSANADLVVGEVINGSNYSLIHNGSQPSGWGDQDDWLRFDDGQSLTFDLSGGIVTLLDPHTFTLYSNNGAIGSLVITSLDLDLNDSDGFAGGTMGYILNGSIPGTFSFADDNYSSIFNTSTQTGNQLDLYIWGGDDKSDLGIDLAFTGLIDDGDEIPVPGTLLLLGLGLVALRRRTA